MIADFFSTVDWGLFFTSVGLVGIPLVLLSIHRASRRREPVLPYRTRR